MSHIIWYAAEKQDARPGNLYMSLKRQSAHHAQQSLQLTTVLSSESYVVTLRSDDFCDDEVHWQYGATFQSG